MVALLADWPAPPPLPEFLAQVILIGCLIGAAVGAFIGLLFGCGGTPADLVWLPQGAGAAAGGVCAGVLNGMSGLFCGDGYIMVGLLAGGASGVAAGAVAGRLVTTSVDALFRWLKGKP